MEQVKFRVWHKELLVYGNQFIKHIVAEDGTEFKCVAFDFQGWIATLGEVLESGKFVLEQYTGRDDKKGGGVYKNSRVELQQYGGGTVLWSDFACGFVVLMDDKHMGGNVLLLPEDSRRIKVIGSIHDDLELEGE